MPMNSVDQVIDRLAENEIWQGNLTDEERTALMAWAARLLTSALEVASIGALARLKTINVLVGRFPVGVERAAFIQAMTE